MEVSSAQIPPQPPSRSLLPRSCRAGTSRSHPAPGTGRILHHERVDLSLVHPRGRCRRKYTPGTEHGQHSLRETHQNLLAEHERTRSGRAGPPGHRSLPRQYGPRDQGGVPRPQHGSLLRDRKTGQHGPACHPDEERAGQRVVWRRQHQPTVLHGQLSIQYTGGAHGGGLAQHQGSEMDPSGAHHGIERDVEGVRRRSSRGIHQLSPSYHGKGGPIVRE
mmetsp:Transcript_11120/g.24552  ORF Transcript_11120/g.24552 Transcript_11120/m.24552 type:complete len:219 (-) Transcript_11120:2825-3481(-)